LMKILLHNLKAMQIRIIFLQLFQFLLPYSWGLFCREVS